MKNIQPVKNYSTCKSIHKLFIHELFIATQCRKEIIVVAKNVIMIITKMSLQHNVICISNKNIITELSALT